MNGWRARCIAVFVAVLLAGALAGLLAAEVYALSAVATLAALLAGALIALVMLWCWSLKRASALIRWLADDSAGEYPSAGVGMPWWNELTLRLSRALRRRDREIQSERAYLLQFLEALQVAPIGVLLLDELNRLLWGNASAARAFGLILPRDYQQYLANLVREPAFGALLDAYAKSPQDNRLRLMRRKAQPETLEIQIISYGTHQHKMVLVRDVTDQERTDQMRRDFVANVSHEIRTPLTVLAGFIETMQQLPLDEEERRRYLGLMAQQSGRMHNLINDLLALARLEGSPPPEMDHWVSVDALFTQTEQAARELSDGHELRFDDEGQGGCLLAGEQTELLSALTNLVANAIRYTPRGSRVSVQWRRESDGGGELTVQDNGPGIPQEHLTRLTERFYRVDKSRSRQTGGTGLGLSIVKHIMQRHGGALEIRSTPGQGSTFTLRFPANCVREGENRSAGEAGSHGSG